MRKLVTYAVVVATIVWSLGLAAVVPASAAYAPTSGDLIKTATDSALYYIDADGSRNLFVNEVTFWTWYGGDWSGITMGNDAKSVMTISQEDFDNLDAGGHVTVRPGTKLIKFQNSPRVYAVTPTDLQMVIGSDGDDTIAKALYGDDYTVITIQNGFESDYSKGSALSTGSDLPNASLIKYEGSEDIYYIQDGMKRIVEDDAFMANGFMDSSVVTVPTSMTYTSGSSITEAEAAISSIDGSSTTVAAGNLQVALSASTPVSASIAKNGPGVVYTTISVTAGSEAVDITGVAVSRTGIGIYGDIDKVYVEVDNVRRGSKRTFTDASTINFNTAATKITVSANSTVKINIVADMASIGATTGNQNALTVTGITTSASVSGLPVTGNLMSVSAINAPAITVTFPGSTVDVKMGEEQVIIAEMKIVNNSGNEEGITLNNIVLKNTGDASASDVINYTLYNSSGVVLAGPVDANGSKLIAFALSMGIDAGKNETFTVKADIIDGRTRTVILGVDQATDVSASGDEHGWNAVVTDSGGDDTYTIASGDLAINEDSTNPSSQNVSADQDDVVFLAAELKATDEPVVVTSMTFTLGTTTRLDNVTIKLDGDIVAGPTDVSAGNTQVVFTDNFEVSGTQVLTFEADIPTLISGSYSVALTAANTDSESLDGTALTESGDATGGTVTVGSATPTLVKDNTYGNRTIVASDNDVLLAQYIVKASDFEGLKITKYAVNFTNSTESDYIDNLWISESTTVDSTVTVANNFTVTGSAAILAAGESRVIKVYGDLNSSIGTITVELDIDADGEISDTSGNVSDVVGQTMTAGSAHVRLVASSGTANATILLAGSTSSDVAEFTFGDNTNGVTDVGYDVTEVTIQALDYNGTVATSAVISVNFAGKDITMLNGIATSTISIRVDKDSETDVLLSATFNSFSNMDNTSTSVKFAISAYKYQLDSATTEVSIVGGTATTTSVMEVRAALPTVIVTAGSSILSGGTNKAMTIKVIADTSGEDMTWTTMNIKVTTSTAATITGLSIMDGDSVTADLLKAGVATYTDGSSIVTYALTPATAEAVSAGATGKTYTIKLVIAGTLADDDYMTLELLDGTNFTWGDGQKSSIDGDLIDGIPESVTLTK